MRWPATGVLGESGFDDAKAVCVETEAALLPDLRVQRDLPDFVEVPEVTSDSRGWA